MDKNCEIEQRAKSLLALMSLDEKVAQMHVGNFEEYGDGIWKKLEESETVPFGGLFFTAKTKQGTVERLQKFMKERTRLGIPLLICGEGLHGYLCPNATVFPQSLGVSCSFNEELIEAEAKEIGREAYSRGSRQLFAPNLDVTREIRWGRVQETYGEDPYLIGKLGAAYVKGLQSQGIAATLKHFAGYSNPENGINLSSVHIGEREMREIMLPAFEECIQAGAMSVMPAYNEIDGEPLHLSKKYLNDVLRDELGFEGTTISDWGGVGMLKYFHNVIDDDAYVGKKILEAGLDIEAPDAFAYSELFKEKVLAGEIPMELVDQAVLRVLKLKFKLGLFDDNTFETKKPLRTKKSIALARKAAEQSLVLLKNENVLPLSQDQINKVAVIGPNAKLAQLGNYTFYPMNKTVVSLYQGLAEKLGDDRVLCTKGCDIAKRDEKELQKAIDLAKQSDVVVLALGDNSTFFGGIGWGDEGIDEPVTCGEGFDVSSLDLSDAQKELLNCVKECDKPIVLVLYTGRPMVIVDEYEKSNAVLQAWYPGEQGGRAVADALFGDVNPSGKLTVSFPRSTGHIPCYYNHHVSARGAFYKKPGSPEKPGRDYVFASPKSFLPFGYGLSYTSYEYKSLSVKQIGEREVEVTVRVTNTGERDGEEIVLVYVKQEYAETVPFIKQLKAFKRVKIKAGKTKIVKLKLDKEAFSSIGKDYKKKYASGGYFIYVADKTAKIVFR